MWNVTREHGNTGHRFWWAAAGGEACNKHRTYFLFCQGKKRKRGQSRLPAAFTLRIQAGVFPLRDRQGLTGRALAGEWNPFVLRARRLHPGCTGFQVKIQTVLHGASDEIDQCIRFAGISLCQDRIVLPTVCPQDDYEWIAHPILTTRATRRKFTAFGPGLPAPVPSVQVSVADLRQELAGLRAMSSRKTCYIVRLWLYRRAARCRRKI
jgi:hypothetical protein